MKNRNRIIRVLLCSLMGMSFTLTFAQDWPQWRGLNRDGKVSGFEAPDVWPEKLTRIWSMPVGLGDASPALVGDRLYLFVQQEAEEVTLCLDANTGKVIWEDRHSPRLEPGLYSDPFRFQHPGPRSSPTVADGKVVSLGVGGTLSCLDAETGKVVWRNEEHTRDVPTFFTAMSPIVVNGMCIAHLGGKDSGSILAFDLSSGNVVWQRTGDGPAYASPVLMSVGDIEHLVVQTRETLIGIAVADGALLWQVPSAVNSSSFYNAVTPLIYDQTIIHTGQGNGISALKIEKSGADFTSRELWRNEEVNPQYSTPVLKNDLLYGLSKRRHLFCIDAMTGKTAWTDPGRNDSYGAMINAGPVILCLPGNSELIVFAPERKQYQELARYEVSDSPTYAHPVIAGELIYIKDKETLTKWTFR